MPTRASHLAAVVAAGALACPAPAQTLAAPPPTGVVTPSQPWAIQFDLASAISGRTYRIYVRKPDTPPPARGYPVIVVLDGNVSFPIATVAGLFAEVEGRGNALIVGVGYPSDDLKTLTIMRNRDLTPSQPSGGIRQYPGYPTMTAADFGGSELFYRFLTEELRPHLAARYSIDRSDQTLAGHSLGGLFTLGVLFRHPEAFRTYVAMSPALWWNDRALLTEEPAFAARVAGREIAPRLLMTAGGQEEDVPATLPPGTDRAAVIENFRVNGIITNARALSARLSAIRGRPGYVVRLHIIEGAHHNTSMPDAVTRAVTFAVEPTMVVK